MPSERENFAKRLNEALDDAGVPAKGMGRQSALVRMSGVSHRLAKQWLDGEEFPKTSKLVMMANELGVRSNWLLSGQGAKHPGEHAVENPVEKPGDNKVASPEPQAQARKAVGELGQEAFELAAEWMRLPPQQRIAIKRVIQELVLATKSE